jgi:signal transduction histidine kinase/CheY-like chemotaxis protein
MSSNRGIFRVDETQLRRVADGELARVDCIAYTEADGLPAREANGGVQSAGLRDRGGRLWFPTVSGVAVIDPTHQSDNSFSPPVVIEEVRVAGAAEALPIPQAGTALRLQPHQRSLEISYTGLSFRDPERVRFRVLLEGPGDQWIDVGGRRQILYTNLGPGNYRFRVLAANEHGVWSPQGAELLLSVEPRFWETTAARGGAVALSLALGLGVVAERSRRHRRRERQLEEGVERRTVELADALQRVTQQAESLREVDAAKSQFFAYVAHELRTPLTLLLSPLRDAETNPARLAADASVMRRAARGLQRLVDQILDLEKAEAGQLELSLTPRDLGAVATRVLEDFHTLSESWGVRLLCDVAPPWPGTPQPVAAVDVEQIQRALANLISNALRFTPAGGSVALRIFTAGHEVSIEVADTGCGIASDELERIFDRFYQASSLRPRPDRNCGTGLGLALVRELVRLHHGRIEVQSEVGLGTTFRIQLPLSLEVPVALGPEDGVAEVCAEPLRDRAPFDAESPEEGFGSSDSRQTVLVVDDNPDIRAYVCRLLGGELRTVPAPDGSTALRLARRLLPDLVVADVGMPQMDGFELARRLDADPETAGIPVVFLTARVNARDEAAGFAAGAVAYVRKPFSGDLLEAQVVSLLQRQRRLRERLRQVAQHSPNRPLESTEKLDLATRARQVILEHLDDGDFGAAELARALAMGRSALFDRFRSELGIQPGELVRAIRLERGRELLDLGSGSVSEVAYAVGFGSLAAFSRAYRARYGHPPSATLAAKRDLTEPVA